MSRHVLNVSKDGDPTTTVPQLQHFQHNPSLTHPQLFPAHGELVIHEGRAESERDKACREDTATNIAVTKARRAGTERAAKCGLQ